ncbi:MAG: PilZ domain-containing protein [bacterium]
MRGKDRFNFNGIQCEIGDVPMPVANLSLGGFFVASEHPIAPGQVIAVHLVFPSRSFPLHVKVAWVNEGPTPKHPQLPTGFGVSIKQIDLGDKLALIELLRQAARVQPPPTHAVRATGR